MRYGEWARKNFAVAGVLATALVATGAKAEEGIQVSKLNKALSKIVREVLAAHQAEPNPLFKAIDFKIDEKRTILDSDDKFATKINLKAAANRSRWSPSVETTLAVDLGLDADRVKQEVTAEIAGSLETDSLGLVRFVAGELKADWCKPKAKPEPLDAEYCKAMTTLASAKSIDEVIKTIGGMGELAVKEAKARVAKAEAELAAAPAHQKAIYEKRLELAKQDLTIAGTVAAELRRGATAGATNGTLRVAFRSFDAAPYGEVRDVELYLDKNRFDAKLKFTMKDLKDIDSYFKMKPMVLDALKKLEAGDKEETEEAKRFLELYLRIAASLIEGK